MMITRKGKTIMQESAHFFEEQPATVWHPLSSVPGRKG
jgi:hypothetical protein